MILEWLIFHIELLVYLEDLWYFFFSSSSVASRSSCPIMSSDNSHMDLDLEKVTAWLNPGKQWALDPGSSPSLAELEYTLLT